MKPHVRRPVVIISSLVAIVVLGATIIIGCAQSRPAREAGVGASEDLRQQQLAKIDQADPNYANENKGKDTAGVGPQAGAAGGIGVGAGRGVAGPREAEAQRRRESVAP